MPTIKNGDATIYFEEFGSGFPIFTIAPGSLNATIASWRSAPFDPTTELAGEFRVIAMDQRNAGGKSWAPITADASWDQFTSDHLAVLDHLGIDRCHLLGQCIGGPLSMNFLKTEPRRVAAAVFCQPSGRIGPDTHRASGFDRWREKLTDHPEATPEVLDAFRANLYRDDFVYTVSRDFVRTVQTPMLVLAGNDDAHPFQVAKELAELAPNAEFIPEWKSGAPLQAALKRIHEFLHAHTPQEAAVR